MESPCPTRRLSATEPPPPARAGGSRRAVSAGRGPGRPRRRPRPGNRASAGAPIASRCQCTPSSAMNSTCVPPRAPHKPRGPRPMALIEAPEPMAVGDAATAVRQNRRADAERTPLAPPLQRERQEQHRARAELPRPCREKRVRLRGQALRHHGREAETYTGCERERAALRDLRLDLVCGVLAEGCHHRRAHEREAERSLRHGQALAKDEGAGDDGGDRHRRDGDRSAQAEGQEAGCVVLQDVAGAGDHDQQQLGRPEPAQREPSRARHPGQQRRHRQAQREPRSAATSRRSNSRATPPTSTSLNAYAKRASRQRARKRSCRSARAYAAPADAVKSALSTRSRPASARRGSRAAHASARGSTRSSRVGRPGALGKMPPRRTEG